MLPAIPLLGKQAFSPAAASIHASFLGWGGCDHLLMLDWGFPLCSTEIWPDSHCGLRIRECHTSWTASYILADSQVSNDDSVTHQFLGIDHLLHELRFCQP